MANGVDYSWSRPGGAAIKASGAEAVGRYLYPGVGKGLGTAELADLRANGLALWLIYEGTGSDATSEANGVNDARIAEAQAQSLGFGYAPIYFTCDWDVTEAQMPGVLAYIAGAVSVLGHDKVGVYGSYDVVEAVVGGGHAKYGFQTYAWSRGKVSSHAHIYQHLNGQTINGGSVDLDYTLQSDFGQAVGGGQQTTVSAPSTIADGSNKSGVATTVLQEQLNKFGYRLTVDGVYGPATTSAVKAFQKSKGLTVDGVAGSATEGALAKGPASSAGKLSVDGVLGPITIERWQAVLRVGVDGRIGPLTVRAIQKTVGVRVDGVLGQQTREAVQKHLGVAVDGTWGSKTITALQERLNEGKF